MYILCLDTWINWKVTESARYDVNRIIATQICLHPVYL